MEIAQSAFSRSAFAPLSLSRISENSEFLEYASAQTTSTLDVSKIALAALACTAVAGRVSASYTPATGECHYGLRRLLLHCAHS